MDPGGGSDQRDISREMSSQRQGCGAIFDTWVARLTAVIALFVAIWGLPQIIDRPPDGDMPTEVPNETPSDDRFFTCADADLLITPGTGISGTEIVVMGTGFLPDREVDLRFATATLPGAMTDSEGNFTQTVTIPGIRDFVAPSDETIGANHSPPRVGCEDTAIFALQPR